MQYGSVDLKSILWYYSMILFFGTVSYRDMIWFSFSFSYFSNKNTHQQCDPDPVDQYHLFHFWETSALLIRSLNSDHLISQSFHETLVGGVISIPLGHSGLWDPLALSGYLFCQFKEILYICACSLCCNVIGNIQLLVKCGGVWSYIFTLPALPDHVPIILLYCVHGLNGTCMCCVYKEI